MWLAAPCWASTQFDILHQQLFLILQTWISLNADLKKLFLLTWWLILAAILFQNARVFSKVDSFRAYSLSASLNSCVSFCNLKFWGCELLLLRKYETSFFAVVTNPSALFVPGIHLSPTHFVTLKAWTHPLTKHARDCWDNFQNTN